MDPRSSDLVTTLKTNSECIATMAIETDTIIAAVTTMATKQVRIAQILSSVHLVLEKIQHRKSNTRIPV